MVKPLNEYLLPRGGSPGPSRQRRPVLTLAVGHGSIPMPFQWRDFRTETQLEGTEIMANAPSVSPHAIPRSKLYSEQLGE